MQYKPLKNLNNGRDRKHNVPWLAVELAYILVMDWHARGHMWCPACDGKCSDGEGEHEEDCPFLYLTEIDAETWEELGIETHWE